MNSNQKTVTFLFTDLEDSTPLWENHPELMEDLAARHDALLREAIEAHDGQVVKSTGDGFFAVFRAAVDGVKAAIAGQLALLQESWPGETGPLRVRMGLHTGVSQLRDGDYFGSEVNRAARVMGLGHGGQVLASLSTAALIQTRMPTEIELIDMGEHRLKGLTAAEKIYQISHPSLPSDFPALRSLSVYKHNLPLRLSSFVGREQELEEVKRLLKRTHMLTLLGPGGTGKTRLMLEAAEEVIGEFADGVWLVELAPLSNPTLIPERIASALSLQELPGRSMTESLADYLHRKETLILLDNVEHLVKQCADLAEHLLTHCPGLKIMTTGREALFIGGEITLQVPSLSLPGKNGEIGIEEIRDSEGVRLFLDRAQGVRPDFELTPVNASKVREIVVRLDGVPLAIELAAARTRMLSIDQIVERLEDRFRLLTGGSRTALPRQQTLQAMIDWSWQLLDEEEQIVFRRLSVFSGGWTLEAAQSVVSDDQLDEFMVFDLLEQLVNKSLVTVSYPSGGEARYSMLESIRQYSSQRLLDSGESAALRDKHANYFVAFAEKARPHLAKGDVRLWTCRVSLELDNLRAVLAWTQEEHPELALRIGGSLLFREAYSLSPREARSWLEPAIEKSRILLETEDESFKKSDFLRALLGLGLANGIGGRTEIALSIAEECIQLARRFGEPGYQVYAVALKYFQHPFNMTGDEMRELEEAIAISRENKLEEELGMLLIVYGTALDSQGKPDLAMPVLQEAVEINRRTSTRLDAGIFGVQARLARSLGNLDEARRSIETLLEDYKAMNHRRGIIMGQSAMAHILREKGDLDDAEDYYRKAVVGWQELGHRPAVAHQLECFAYIAIARGKHRRAALLLGAAKELREQLNAISEDPQEIADLEQAMEHLAEAMGLEERNALLEEGMLLNMDDAVQEAVKDLS